MAFLDKFCALSVLLKVRKTFTSEFSSVLVLGSPCPGKCRLVRCWEVSPGFKSSKEWVLPNIYSSDIYFSYGHSSGVIPVVLSMEAGRDFLFAILVMVFPRCVLGTNTGQSGQGQGLRNLVTEKSESEHWGRVGFTLFALTQECSNAMQGFINSGCLRARCAWWVQRQPGSGAGQGSFPNPLPETCPMTWAVSLPSTAVQP